ncbi:reverse transcriptase domain-containing protein [Tanacetum coccineum]
MHVQNNQNRFSQPQGYNRGNNFNQNTSYQAPIQQNQVVPLSELEKIKKINEVNIKAMQAQINNVKNELRNEMQTSIQASMSNQTNELKNMMASFFQMNTASTSGSGSLPSNTVANPRGELKAITTRSGLVLDGPSVSMPPLFINPKEDERAEETLTDSELTEYTIKVPPPLVQKAKPTSLKNYVVHKRDPLHPNIPYPSRMHQEKQQEKDEVQIHKFWQMFKQLYINISLADALILIPKYQKMLKRLLFNKEKLLELANTPLNENCSTVILKKLLPKKLGRPWKISPFTPLVLGNKYILVAVDYLSKWVEAKAFPTNDARVVVKNLKSLFARFGTPRPIISDRGTHFRNDEFTKVMLKYGVTHRLATTYRPQTSGQVEVSNRGLKRILERTVGENRASWSDKLDDALWAFRTAFKTPNGCTLYKLVYGKACHLLIELEHKAYWALKHANFDLKSAGDHWKVQLNELNKLLDQAYENSLIYKKKTKKIHDSKIKNRIFNVGDRVLFNSRLKIFSGKLKTRWTGPFTVAQVFPYGTVELSQTDGPNFKVNGHRLKHYFGGDIPPMVVSDLQTFPKDN